MSSKLLVCGRRGCDNDLTRNALYHSTFQEYGNDISNVWTRAFSTGRRKKKSINKIKKKRKILILAKDNAVP